MPAISRGKMRSILRRIFLRKRGDRPRLRVIASFKLEKFDGEYEPGKEPVEVIEGGDGLPTTTTRKEHADGA